MRYVGLDCPPWYSSTVRSLIRGSTCLRRKAASAAASNECSGATSFAPGFAGASTLDCNGAAVDRERVAGDVARGFRCEKDHAALQVLLAAESVEWCELQHLALDALQRDLGHFRQKEAGADRVDIDVVPAPLRGEGARQVDQRALAGVVADGGHPPRRGIAIEPGDGGYVDDLGALSRDHRAPPDFTTHEELRVDVER